MLDYELSGPKSSPGDHAQQTRDEAMEALVAITMNKIMKNDSWDHGEIMLTPTTANQPVLYRGPGMLMEDGLNYTAFNSWLFSLIANNQKEVCSKDD